MTTRDTQKGHLLSVDYHYWWDAARDGDDLSMGWMRGLRCAVCEPMMPSEGRAEGRAVRAVNWSPVQAILMLDVDDFEERSALADRMDTWCIRFGWCPACFKVDLVLLFKVVVL